MSDTATQLPLKPRAGLRRFFRIIIILWVLAACFLVVLFKAAMGQTDDLDLICSLAFGWISFLQRTVPRITLNPDLLGMGIFCATAASLLAHWFLSWLTRNIADARNTGWRWPWRWTWCGLCGVLVLFLVGMAMGGVAHQIGWIASSPEPWAERKRYNGEYFNEMRELDGTFQQALLETKGSVADARHRMWNPRTELYGSPAYAAYASTLLESYHFLLITDGNDKVVGEIIFPRDTQRRSRVGGMYLFGDSSEFVPSEKLPDLIRSHQGKLIAL